jgi:hypothetical protein
MGGWKRLCNVELHTLCASPSVVNVIKSKWMRWAGHVARYGERNVHTISAGKPEEMRPL